MTDPTPNPTTPPPAAPPAPPAADPAPPAPPEGKPLGPNGEKALQAEREARQALEKQLHALKPLAELLGGKPSGDTKTDLEKLTERMGELERTAADERLARLRIEVAAEKGLTPAQAARISGTSRDELAADADALRALFPTAPPGPKPDPSQGANPGGSPTYDQQAAEALSKGDVKSSIALKAAQLTNPQ